MQQLHDVLKPKAVTPAFRAAAAGWAERVTQLVPAKTAERSDVPADRCSGGIPSPESWRRKLGDEAARRFLCDVVPKHAPWSAAEGDDAAAEELLDYIGEVYDGPDGLPRIRSMRLGLGGSPPRSDPAVAQSRA